MWAWSRHFHKNDLVFSRALSMSSTWWWLSWPSKMRIWGRSSPTFFRNTFSNHMRDMFFKEEWSCLNKDAFKCPKHFVSEGKQTIWKEWWNVIYTCTCFVHPESDPLMKDPKGAFSVSQDLSASCVLPFVMKWGDVITPAALPHARIVMFSRFPDFEWMYFVPVLDYANWKNRKKIIHFVIFIF